MIPTFKRSRFLTDLAEELTWLRDNAGPEVAERWYQHLNLSIAELQRHPHLGRPRLDLKPSNIRTWRVKKYPRWLIFYRINDDGALVLLRVRSGTMNLPVMFIG